MEKYFLISPLDCIEKSASFRSKLGKAPKFVGEKVKSYDSHAWGKIKSGDAASKAIGVAEAIPLAAAAIAPGIIAGLAVKKSEKDKAKKSNDPDKENKALPWIIGGALSVAALANAIVHESFVPTFKIIKREGSQVPAEAVKDVVGRHVPGGKFGLGVKGRIDNMINKEESRRRQQDRDRSLRKEVEGLKSRFPKGLEPQAAYMIKPSLLEKVSNESESATTEAEVIAEISKNLDNAIGRKSRKVPKKKVVQGKKRPQRFNP